MLTAYVSLENGRALVFDGDSPIHSLDTENEEPQNARHIQIGMWAQSFGPLEEADPGEYPYQELHERLRISATNHAAFRSLLLHFDTGVSEQTRKEILDEVAEGMKEDPVIREFIIEQLKSRYMPDSADVSILLSDSKYADIVSAIEEGRSKNKPVPLPVGIPTM